MEIRFLSQVLFYGVVALIALIIAILVAEFAIAKIYRSLKVEV
nr:hypothetical protein [Sulfurimonas sp. MAG313]